jgi:excisionase family DNA binding protein
VVEPLLHTVKEACELLNISRATLYRLHEDGLIDFVKVRTGTFVTDAEVRRYIATITPPRTYVRRYVYIEPQDMLFREEWEEPSA